MAGTITATIGFQVAKGNYQLDKPEETLDPITWNGQTSSEGIMLVGTGATGEAIPLGDVAIGWVWFRNLHASATIDIGILFSGTFKHFLLLKAGEVAFFRHNQFYATYAKASAADTPLEYRILSD